MTDGAARGQARTQRSLARHDDVERATPAQTPQRRAVSSSRLTSEPPISADTLRNAMRIAPDDRDVVGEPPRRSAATASG